MNTAHARSIHALSQALTVRQVTERWYIGTTTMNQRQLTFFARTEAELLFKYRRVRLAALRSAFYGGQAVRLRTGSARPYIIAALGLDSNGTPSAWLNGRPGCVPLDQLVAAPSAPGIH